MREFVRWIKGMGRVRWNYGVEKRGASGMEQQELTMCFAASASSGLNGRMKAMLSVVAVVVVVVVVVLTEAVVDPG